MKEERMTTLDEIFPRLFTEVQTQGLFSDSKTFADAIPLSDPDMINKKYEELSTELDFSLEAFVFKHFEIPEAQTSGFESQIEEGLEAHVERLWPYLRRSADEEVEGGSLIPLKRPYIVPGGRFREIYYWDSFFTMLGLLESGHKETVRNMIDNFCDLIDRLGFVPNGNRSYFATRSQPPFLSLMVRLLAKNSEDYDEIIWEYAPYLEKEYGYWMNGKELWTENYSASGCLVRLEGDEYLNRYWDSARGPRLESYLEDVELAEESDQDAEDLWQNLRAACASGWDFSARWLDDHHDLSSIKCLELIPIDLNALMLHLEELLAQIYAHRDESKALRYSKAAASRKELINKYLWSHEGGFFGDFQFSKQKHTEFPSAAMFFALYFGIADDGQASKMMDIFRSSFLKSGGLVTTLVDSGQQWDFPNGWPPLQWMAYEGMKRYGFIDEAEDLRKRWLSLCERVFHNTGKMMEKYDVTFSDSEAGGGEYPVQDGFGWTNGVYLNWRNA